MTTNLTIDGRTISVEDGTLVIEAAQKIGITVPHFCYHPRLEPIAACRLCLVEIEGMRGLQPSCMTPVKDGMVVQTKTQPALDSHREVLDLVLENHPLDCPKCEAAGRCQLEDFTYEFGPHRVSNYKPPGLSGIDYQEVAWSPLIKFDPYKCVECTRCTRVCDEIHDCTALTSESRGHSFLITTFADGPLHCDFCGSCASVCPTGAIEQQPGQYFKKDWEYLERNAICTHCAHGCTLVLKTHEEKIAKVDDDYALGINNANLCSRGRFGFDILRVENRVIDPMIRKNGKLESVTWDEALEAAANAIRDKKNILGIASGYLAVEDLYALGEVVTDRRSDSREGDIGLRSTVNFDQVADWKKIAIVECDVEQIDYVAQVDIAQAARNGAEIIAIGEIGPRLARYAKSGSVDQLHSDTLVVCDAERVSKEVLDLAIDRGCGLILLASQPNSRALGSLGYRALGNETSEVVLIAGPVHIEKRPDKCKTLIVSAHYAEGVAMEADILFPAAMNYEKPGTYVNSEGRAQFSAAAVKPHGYAWPDAAIWSRLGNKVGKTIPTTPREMIKAANAKMANAKSAKGAGTTRLPVYGKYDGRLLRHSKWTKTMTDHLDKSKDFAPWPS